MVRLHEQVRLRREGFAVVFFRRDRIIGGDVHFIHPKLAYLVLSSEMDRLDEAARRTDMTEAEIRDHLTRFIERHPSCYVDRATSSSYVQGLDPDQWLFEPAPLPLIRRLSWPINLNIIVTDECVFGCKYCCITTRPHGEGTAINLDVFERIIHEAVDRGSEAVNLHGGEPTLHPELPELIACAAGRGMHVSFSTKALIDQQYADKLVAKGLKTAQVSIDSPDFVRERQLTGVDLQTLFTSARTLTRAGVDVSVNTIVTSTTADELEHLVECCVELGVKELGLSVYSYAPDSHHPQFMLSGDEFQRLEQLAGDMTSNDLPVNFSTPHTIDSLGSSTGCSSLRIAATITPDGSLCVCDKMAHDKTYSLGSDLVTAWNSPSADELVNPSRQLFVGTACEKCELFDQCLTRGRCIFRTLVLHGRIHAPDRDVPQCTLGGELQ